MLLSGDLDRDALARRRGKKHEAKSGNDRALHATRKGETHGQIPNIANNDHSIALSGDTDEAVSPRW
jgi:hypothetical protein